jgi:hypothetical protein
MPLAMAKDTEVAGPRFGVSQAKAGPQPNIAEAHSADSALAVSGSAPTAPRSGPAGNNFRAARAPVFSASRASIAAPLRYTVLRRTDEGAFELIDPANLHAGDTIELRLESIVEGEISLSEGEPTSADSTVLLRPTHIVPGQTLITPPIAPASPGSRVITLRLTHAEGPPTATVVRLNYR